jgi:hypothetical protein
VVEGRHDVEGRLKKLDAHSWDAVTVRAILARTNPPDLGVDSEGLVPVRQREFQRNTLADGRGLGRSHEDPTEADVAGLSGDTLAVEGEDDRDSEIDATRACDDGHVFVIVAGFGPDRSSAADGTNQESPSNGFIETTACCAAGQIGRHLAGRCVAARSEPEITASNGACTPRRGIDQGGFVRGKSS